MDGMGVQVWPDGSRYDGFWQNGKKNGYGRFILVENIDFDGEVRDEFYQIRFKNIYTG